MKDLRTLKDEIIRDVKNNKKILIAAHRGSANGNIVQNTTAAYQAALLQGSHIIECDVSRTTDGHYVMFHDGMEDFAFRTSQNIQTLTMGEVEKLRYVNPNGERTNQKVQTLKEALYFMKGKGLMNLDRCWDHWPEIIPMVQEREMEDQIILKSPPRQKILRMLVDLRCDFFYIPIVQTMEELHEALAFDLNFLGAEIVFDSVHNTIASSAFFNVLKNKNLLLWGNAIKLGDIHFLADNFDDDTSILKGPDQGWGRLIQMGFHIIQTDWPGMLRGYLDQLNSQDAEDTPPWGAVQI